MSYEVIIIGGGLAGLSAAVDLSARGARILLLEQKPHLGGRTYSYRDKKTGDTIDNGQHLLMGCYRTTRAYLNTIQSAHLATLQKNLRIDFLRPNRDAASLNCLPLPAPLNIASGLVRLGTLSLADRLRLLRMGVELLAASKQKEQQLASLTVDEWLRQCGQSPENRKYLWDVIAIGSLNDDPSEVSALLFYRTLKTAFLGARENSSLLIPRVGLTELLVDPAVRFIRQQGGDVRTGETVTRLVEGKNGVDAIVCGKRKEKAGVYVSAVPYYALDPILPESWKSSLPMAVHLGKFKSSPIITLHLWFDRAVMHQEFAAVLDSTIQWVFNKSRMFGTQGNRQYLSVVISAASKIVSLSKDQLVAIALKDLAAILPITGVARLEHSVVIKEKRATFSPVPSILSRRPQAAIGVENFFLAGDWTDTGFPATIEGAVMSGQKAAREAAGVPA